METENVQKVHKDMTIAQILQLNPQKSGALAQLMTAAGLHCVGCGASTFETLEEGLMGHGYSEDQLYFLIDQLNEALDVVEEKKVGEKDEHDITPVALTEKGISKVKEIMKSEGKEGWGLRVGVVPGGCSGYSYELSFEEKEREDDKIIDQEGIKLFVDAESYEMLNGVVVDFVDNLNESGFKFSNPNAKSGCGCGKSFN